MATGRFMSVNVYLLGGRVKKVATHRTRFRQKASFRDQTVSPVGTMRPMRSLLCAVLLLVFGQACDVASTCDCDVAGSTTSGARGNEAGTSGAPRAGGSDSMLTLKQPIDRGMGKLVLELGATYFEVDPSHGARVTSLRHGGQELLTQTGAANYADAVGSTFWPSPQSWPWPPPAEIDSLPYSASIDATGTIALEGQLNADTGLKVSKKFSADLLRDAIRLEYSMTNPGTEPVQWAPWEITRMPATGLAFWPSGGEPFGDRPLGVTSELGHTWCDPTKTPGEAKVFADGAGGVLAYVLGDRLLIKQFQDQPASAAAPGEAEIELYVNPDHDYLELENQGAYVTIAPGATVTWQVVWYVRQLPGGVAPGVASQDLVAFVAKTLE